MVSSDLSDHPKCIRLASKLRIKSTDAAGLLVTFWGWVVRFRESGSLKKLSISEISSAAKWTGTAKVFVSAMKATGWIDTTPHAQVHDWQEHAGKLIRARIQDRERKRQERSELSDGSPKDVPRTRRRNSDSHNNNSTVLDSTQHNSPDLDHPDLDRVDVGRGVTLLLSVGIPEGVARPLACETTIGRIHDIVVIASKKGNPGGWARKAISENWEVPKDSGRIELLQDLKSTGSKIPPSAPSRVPDRKQGESDDDYLKRMNDELVIRRRESDER